MTHERMNISMHVCVGAGNASTSKPLEGVGDVRKGGYSDWSEVRALPGVMCSEHFSTNLIIFFTLAPLLFSFSFSRLPLLS